MSPHKVKISLNCTKGTKYNKVLTEAEMLFIELEPLLKMHQ